MLPRRPLPLLLLGWLVAASAVFAAETHLVAMRDGVKLATDVYTPPGDGPWPVILLRTPYNKTSGTNFGAEANKRGYVFVAQDTRGRFGSEGPNLAFEADGRADGQWDGVDCVDWIAKQPWCNGRIGTWGGSANAITSYLLAGAGARVVSQHLTFGTSSLFQDGVYRGGIFRSALVEGWLEGIKAAPDNLMRWTTHYPHTRYWVEREATGRFDQINAVAIHLGGWFDIFAQATIDAFLGYQNEGGPGARGRQKLVMGPWVHGGQQEQVGDLVYPTVKTTPANLQDSWQWFAATLKGETNNVSTAPAVTYFVMGASGEPGAPGNGWRSSERWPPANLHDRPLHLRSDRTATLDGDSGSGELTYTSDPTKPVPSIGGYELTLPAGPRDQRSIEARDDLLVFTTPPLEQPLEVTGNITAQIRLSCDTPDADLIVRLCDVYPDGRSFNICEGALRLRLRHGFDREEPMTPDPVNVSVRFWPTSMIFNRGHRLRVHIASSSSPALEPNRQNGEPPRTGEPRRARIKVLFDGSHPRLLLPGP